MKKVLLLLGCAALGGCVESVRQEEARLATTMAELQNQATTFGESRRQLVKARQGVINGFEADTALSQNEAARLVGAWRISGEQDKAALYEKILAATDAAAKAEADFRALRVRHEKTMEERDTKFQLDRAKLSKAIQDMASLGRGQSPEEAVHFYLGFLAETKKAVDEQRSKATSAKNDGDSAAAKTRVAQSPADEKKLLEELKADREKK